MARKRRLTLSINERASRLAGLALAVRLRREELRLGQEELADLANCSTRFVHMVEHAKPTVQLAKLLDVLDVLGLGFELKLGRGDVVVPPARVRSRNEASAS